MVVVVRNSSPAWLILMALSIISLVIVGILIFALSRGNGNLVVVAIPGFPAESIVLGLALGVLLIFARRNHRGTQVISDMIEDGNKTEDLEVIAANELRDLDAATAEAYEA